MAMPAESMSSEEWLSSHSIEKAGLNVKQLMDKGQIGQYVLSIKYYLF